MMERPSEGGDSCNQFWCDTCKVACASAVNLQTHFIGSKHKLLEKALKAHGIGTSDSPEQADPEKDVDDVVHAPDSTQLVGLAEQLESCMASEPAIGLQYILEYHNLGNYRWYECELCGCGSGLTNMFMHVVGSKHRQAYLQKHYPEFDNVAGRGSEANKKLKQLAADVEAKEGRKKIQVVTDNQQLKRKYGPEEDAPGPNQKRRIDFTSDDCFLDPPPPPPQPAPPQSLPPSATFQELKAAHAAAVKKEGLDKSVDGFGTRKELLEYFRQFQILCEDDAAFVLRVTQRFTQSLVKYREKVKEKAEAAAPAVTCSPQEQNAPQPTSQNIYTEYPTKNMPGQQPPAPLGHNLYTEYPPRNVPGQPAAVSLPSSLPYNAGPPRLNVNLPSGMGPRPETNTATIEFFTSIKNMNAQQVSATLSKIAATNPALKGIDIPNVIKILQQSGSLKISNKGNNQF